jgi:CheY-like chemotaxis protein
MERMLRGKYLVTVMNDGLEGLTWLPDGNTYDVIITDLYMPVVSGLELLEALKGSGLYHDIPVIVLSALETETDTCMRGGAAACLMKLFDPQKLIRMIREVLEEQRSTLFTS